MAVRRNSAFEKWCREHDIPCFPLGFKNDFDFLSALSLMKYCRQENFDLIHLHSSRSHGIAVLAAALGNRIPLVLSRRVDFAPKGNLLTRWKYNHPAIKKVICVSEKIKEIISVSSVSPEKCVTVYDGIDLNRFAGRGQRGKLRNELGIAPDVKLIGNIAAIAPHKDYFTFLKTVKILSQKTNTKFVISGDGPLRSNIESEIDAMDLRKEVFLLGFRNDLENVFADLDVLLYTSKEEGLGSTLLDAMAYGLAVVSTEAGGIPEIVKDGYNGLTAPVGDATMLASQVMRLLNDISLREQLTGNAKEFVKQFSKSVMAEKTLVIYQELLHK